MGEEDKNEDQLTPKEVVPGPSKKLAVNGSPPEPTPAPEGDIVPLDDEAKKIMAEKMGVKPEDIKIKDMKVSQEFLDKLKRGEIEFVKKAATPEDIKRAQERGPGQGTPLALLKPSPRQDLEQRYMSVVQQAVALRKTSNLPQSVIGKPRVAAEVPEGAEDRPVRSAFTERSTKLGKDVLSVRPAGAPSILEECKGPVKLFVSQHQSPGDILMLSRAVDDLHRSYPGMFVTCMRTPAAQLWDNNPNHTQLDSNDPDAMWISMGYKLVNTSNRGAHHFSHGFRKDFEGKLGLPIDQTYAYGAVYLSYQERSWFSQIYEIVGHNVPYWIVDAGRKSDYTAKHWEETRFQELVDRTPEITWVQVGATTKGHHHPELKGDNLIDLRGKTNIRQLVRLMYHAAGVVTPVSFPMHLSAAVPMHPRYGRDTRPTVVIAGGREPAMWEAYSHHQFMHTCGALPCCSHGGCWKSRVMPIGDGDSKDYDDAGITRLCERPVETPSGQVIPKCLDLITVDAVLEKVLMYTDAYNFSDEDATKWEKKPVKKPKAVVDKIRWAVENRDDLKKKKSAEKPPEQAPASQPEPEPERASVGTPPVPGATPDSSASDDSEGAEVTDGAGGTTDTELAAGDDKPGNRNRGRRNTRRDNKSSRRKAAVKPEPAASKAGKKKENPKRKSPTPKKTTTKKKTEVKPKPQRSARRKSK